MTGMGTFRTSIQIESVAERGRLLTVEQAVVDTDSELTWVPGDILRALGIPSEGVERFIVADGRTLERELGIAIVHAAGRHAPDYVVFGEPGDMVLLGSRALQGLNLRVDASRKELVPAGPVLAGTMRTPIGSMRGTIKVVGDVVSPDAEAWGESSSDPLARR